MMLLGALGTAQDNSQSGAIPSPAFGQSAPVLNPDNPPVSGIDEPGLEMKKASRSFISPAIQVGETVDTNENSQLGTSKVEPVSFVLGAFDLQKFWPKTDMFLEYLGGGAFETDPTYEVKQLQALGFEGITRWRTGYLELRDAFNYLPQGAFDLNTVEGLPGYGLAFGVGTGGGVPGIMRFGGGNDAVGDISRLSNTAVADVVQAISPRSAFTLLGAFGNTHYYDNSCRASNSTTPCLDDSDESTVEGGYAHLISRRDQIGVVYAFQLFQFPYSGGGELYNQVFNVRWSRTITGRMRILVALGPQYSDLKFGTIQNNWSLSGRALFHYQFERTSLGVEWSKFTSSGLGYYAGADTQMVRLSLRRPLGRTYDLVTYFGYARNKRLQSAASSTYDFNNDNEGIAGAILRRHMGRTFDLFAAYTFNDAVFDVPAGVTAVPGSGDQELRHRGTIGLEWHPKPSRIE
jgi:hypothetical protein